jgi:hypothetical protein
MPNHVLKLLDYVQERDHILNRIGDEGIVIGIPLAGQFEATRGNVAIQNHLASTS